MALRQCAYTGDVIHYFIPKFEAAKYCCLRCYYDEMGYTWRDYRHQPKKVKDESRELVSAVLDRMVEKRIEERFGKTFLSILKTGR